MKENDSKRCCPMASGITRRDFVKKMGKGSLAVVASSAFYPFPVYSSDRLTSQEDEVDLQYNPPNDTHFGEPCRVVLPEVPSSELEFSFGVITDSHIDATNAGAYWSRDTDKVKKNRLAIDDMNDEFYSSHIVGAVHLGDMVNEIKVQSLVAFRQLFEDSYPGHDGGSIAGVSDSDYDAYSEGHTLNYPLLINIGNHDVTTQYMSEYYVREYVMQRMRGAEGISCYVANEYFSDGSYAWRWGKYHFLSLGLWAGSYGYEGNTDIDYGKLTWLRRWLEENVGDSGEGVFVLQHFGFDGFSREERWWTEEQRQLELDLLCRKDKNGVCNPYNVLGILSGHTHEFGRKKVNTNNIDNNGNTIYFDNYRFTDSGYKDHNFGYAIVTVDGEKLSIKCKYLKPKKKDKWETKTKDISMPLHGYKAKKFDQAPGEQELVLCDGNEVKWFQVEYLNTGTKVWDPDKVFLATCRPNYFDDSDFYCDDDDGYWVNKSMIKMVNLVPVNPGERALFHFKMKMRNPNPEGGLVDTVSHYLFEPVAIESGNVGEMNASGNFWMGRSNQVRYFFQVKYFPT